MTNFEAIKNYSLEEMAKFIAEHDKNCDIADGKYCSEICDQRVKGRCKHDECVRLDMTEEECVREWLKAELIKGTDLNEPLDMAIDALSVTELKPKFESAVPNCQKCAIKELWEETEKEDLVEVVRKPIKGYEDYYEVDQFGRVFAKERTIHVKDHDREYDKHLPSRQMKQSVHTKGYKIVPLTKDGVCTTKFVHRLVAEAFIPNPDDLPFVNHIDEDKTNNFVENLEWCTEQYNSTYGKAREKHAKALKGRHHTEEHKKKISDSLKRFYGERENENSNKEKV